MPRALWKGAISFGLVHVPVGLYPATTANELDFTMLDKRNLVPVGYKRYNKETGKEVAWDDIVKGFEYEKGRYVVMSDEDFRLANVEATQTVDILAFVDSGRIPMSFYDTPYYLAPMKRGEKGYALLREVLRKSGKVGIANVVIRTRQHIAVLVPFGAMLLLNTLRYADEIRPASDLELPQNSLKSVRVSARELDMANRLVKDMTEEWDPKKYHDTFRDDILKRVKEKIKAGESEVITEPGRREKEPKGAKVIDLMELLKRSVDRGAERTAAVRNGGTAGVGTRAPRSAHAATKRRAASARRPARKAPHARSAAGERRRHA